MQLTLHYILFSLTIFLAVGAMAVRKFAPKFKGEIKWRTFAFILMGVLAVRYFSYVDRADTIIGIKDGPFSPFVTTGAYFAIWFELALVVLLIIWPFNKLKTITNFLKFIGVPFFLIYFAFSFHAIESVVYGMNEATELFLFTRIFFLIETGLVAYGLLGVWAENRNVKLSKEEWLNIAYVTIPILLATLPVYGPQILIGPTNIRYKVLDLSATHRLFIYISIAIPVLILLVLRNKKREVIDFSLLYLSVATMITFSNIFYYKNFIEPWTWPLHLCNTAMFIIPITLIFKTERLFYFTYFINVLGALLAMAMPNYSSTLFYTHNVVIRFWYNHAIAFFMPLLLVSLGIYQRPKMRQMYYSLVAFAVYFVAMLFTNVFLEKYHSVDFFFLNSDFIVDKLGKAAIRLYRVNITFTINDYEYVIRPIYQILFLVVYEAASFAMWFVYSLGYTTRDYLEELNSRKKKIKLDKIAIKAAVALEGGVFMKELSDVSLVLTNFSKRYGANKKYAVKDASLVVNGGEIFGFLGPNGAGKSTTIKAIVGIHPITEGTISVCGYDVEKQGVDAKSLIGYVPDHYALYEKLTAREYVNYIADIYGVSEERRTELISEYLKMFNLEDAFDRQIRTFSHGMKQKVTIIAALVHEPKLWLLDEPLTGLDPDSIYQVKQVMHAHAAKGNIVMFSSHLIDVVENLCKRVAVIKNGHLFDPVVVSEIKKEMTLEEYYMKTTV